jgi:hypothetical protein
LKTENSSKVPRLGWHISKVPLYPNFECYPLDNSAVHPEAYAIVEKKWPKT